MAMKAKILNASCVSEDQGNSLGDSPKVNWGISGGSVVQNLPARAGDVGSIPGSEDPSGGGHGYPLQYFRLRIPLWATVHRVAKTWTPLKRISIHTRAHTQHMLT